MIEVIAICVSKSPVATVGSATRSRSSSILPNIRGFFDFAGLRVWNSFRFFVTTGGDELGGKSTGEDEKGILARRFSTEVGGEVWGAGSLGKRASKSGSEDVGELLILSMHKMTVDGGVEKADTRMCLVIWRRAESPKVALIEAPLSVDVYAKVGVWCAGFVREHHFSTSS